MSKDCGRDLDFINYFKDPGLFEELNLVESGVLKLHWSNWNHLLFDIQKKIKNGGELSTNTEISQILDQYKNIEVFIKNKNGSLKSNLFDLYSYYLDPRLRELWFDLNEETLLSFKCESGPFIRLQSMRWFNFEIYKFFVFQRLLSNTGATARSFRMSVHLPVKCEFPDSVLDPITTNIVQITARGFLMKVNSKADLHALKLGEKVKYFANLDPFILSQGKRIIQTNDIFNENVFKSYNQLNQSFTLVGNILELGNNSQNLNYSNGSEFYLFISYDDLDGVNKSLIKDCVSDTVSKYELHALSMLRKAA